MVTYLKGDMFDSPAQILVNTVNVVGVMGKGVALEFKNKYPEMFLRYQKLCEDKKLTVGTLYLWRKEEKWVLLFPTKQHWKNPSKLEYIEKGLQKFADNWDKLGADSIAFPRLGCGNGGLDWNDVKPLMEKYLLPIPMNIFVYVDNYKDPQKEHLEISEIEKWMIGENDQEGYEKFKLKLKHLIERDKGILLDGENTSHITLSGENVIIQNENEIKINDRELCLFWDFVRNAGIVLLDEIPGEFQEFASILLPIMSKLNYLDPVIVSKNGLSFPSRANAFQYIAE